MVKKVPQNIRGSDFICVHRLKGLPTARKQSTAHSPELRELTCETVAKFPEQSREFRVQDPGGCGRLTNSRRTFLASLGTAWLWKGLSEIDTALKTCFLKTEKREGSMCPHPTHSHLQPPHTHYLVRLLVLLATLGHKMSLSAGLWLLIA